jgi:hypothetical protein
MIHRSSRTSLILKTRLTINLIIQIYSLKWSLYFLIKCSHRCATNSFLFEVRLFSHKAQMGSSLGRWEVGDGYTRLPSILEKQVCDVPIPLWACHGNREFQGVSQWNGPKTLQEEPVYNYTHVQNTHTRHCSYSTEFYLGFGKRRQQNFHMKKMLDSFR